MSQKRFYYFNTKFLFCNIRESKSVLLHRKTFTLFTYRMFRDISQVTMVMASLSPMNTAVTTTITALAVSRFRDRYIRHI